MSLARIYTTKKVQKNWTCGKCGAAIVKGQDGRISFAVGFRGREQTRCTRPECRPTRSELESSAVSTVYAAQDDIDYSTLHTLDDLTEARDAVAAAAREVAEEYEANEMYDINEMLQERAEMLNSAADELEGWEPEDEEPSEDDYDEDEDEESRSFEDAHGDWLEAARESLQEAIDGMELP